MLKIPTIAEVTIPIITDMLKLINKSLTFKIVAPNIIGVESKKVNLAAASLDTPISLAVSIVVPLLEKPGITARACEQPTIKACFNVILSKDVSFL